MSSPLSIHSRRAAIFDGALLGESRFVASSQDIVDPCGIGPKKICHNDFDSYGLVSGSLEPFGPC